MDKYKLEDYVNSTIKRSEVESGEKWAEINKEIPTLNFKEEWNVKIIPPYSGAVARFIIIREDEMVCSVYLDWYDRLGCFGSPYYELFPFEDDIKRYSLTETDELMKDINELWNDAK